MWGVLLKGTRRHRGTTVPPARQELQSPRGILRPSADGRTFIDDGRTFIGDGCTSADRRRNFSLRR
ncbi:MAG: hypothetical protein IJ064_01260 [Bacteroidaceae bacterium]|nr:hypothetical protein [Bacteroidaceae bacterium]